MFFQKYVIKQHTWPKERTKKRWQAEGEKKKYSISQTLNKIALDMF
jgi:hypothetical protein